MGLDLTVLEAKRYGVYTCSPDTQLEQVAARMFEEDVSALVVVDHMGYMRGIITHTDVLRAGLQERAWRQLPASDFMSRDVVTVTASATLDEVAELLLSHCIHRVVVVRHVGDGQLPVAVVSSSDLIYQMSRVEGEERSERPTDAA